MTGRILIIDSVPTNRIVLKVKMMAAQYSVDTCADSEEARAIFPRSAPDLILINLANDVESGSAFCRSLRHDPATRDISIIATGVGDSSMARFSALDAGADDVLPRPMNDSLLLSRVRCQLRRRNMGNDLLWRDESNKAYGFEEELSPRIAPSTVTVVCSNAQSGVETVTALQKGLRQSVQVLTGQRQLAAYSERKAPDLFVIHGADGSMSAPALCQTVCDFSARSQTHHASQLVIVPADAPELAAMILDLGAEDVVFDNATADEITLRAKKLIATKVHLDQLRDRVRTGLRAAVTDSLTGLYNRRYAEKQLQQIASDATESNRSFAVMMLDIDHFKSINDRFGHAAGDLVLRQIADRLRETFRDVDLVARIGGEEFLVVLPDTSSDQAAEVGEMFRRIVATKPFHLGDLATDLRVTISVGIAVHKTAAGSKQSEKSLSQMFQRADAALYSAKSAGRDAVSVCRAAA